MMKKQLLAILIFLISMNTVYAAQAPKINSYVTDKAGALSANSRAQLEESLRGLEKSTNGVQFVVYIENEYPKEFSLEDYTLKIAESNGIGKSGNDNGILLYVAVKDKEYRWEIGYGVESVLNSPLIGRISREYLVPRFKENDYETGILQAVDVAQRLLLNSSDPDIIALRKSAGENQGNYVLIFSVMLVLFFLVIISAFISASRNPRKTLKGRHNADIYRGAAFGLFAGGFGRGGFGGSGGFGGFGGGGGRFGGGGFGGRW